MLVGDRCLAFRFAPELFHRIAHDAGARPAFAHNRLPPLRDLSGLTARARRGLDQSEVLEEVAIELRCPRTGVSEDAVVLHYPARRFCRGASRQSTARWLGHSNGCDRRPIEK